MMEDDFNEDGFDDFDGGEFQSFGEILQNEFVRMQRLVFLHDIERNIVNPIPLTPHEFEQFFGELEDEDFEILTKCIIKDMKNISTWKDITKRKMLNKWGVWIEYLLQKNVEYENYEKCVTLRDAQIEYQKL